MSPTEGASPLVRAVGLALIGEDVALAAPAAGDSRGRHGEDRPAPDGELLGAANVADRLVAAGWSPERVQAVRRRQQDAEQPWPFPVPRDLLAAVGFARFHAVLAEVRVLLGVDGLVPTVHQGPKVLGPAEQRLLAEVPPHHGNVG